MGWHLNLATGSVPVDIAQWPQRRFGWAGVDLFFVLSGFLVGRLIFQEVERTGGFSYSRFLIRRVFRLWPVLYVYILAQLALTDKDPARYFWQVFFHVQNYFATDLPHLWSLAVEEHFYILAGLLIPLVASRATPARGYALALAAILIACPVLRAAATNAGFGRLPIQTWTNFRIDVLAAGVLVALVHQKWPELFERLARPKLLLLAIAVACFASLAWVSDQFHDVPASDTTMLYLGNVASYEVAMIGSVALVLAANDWQYPRLLHGPMVLLGLLGLYSYSIYIWHFALGGAGERLVLRLGFDGPVLLLGARYGAAILGSIAISVAIERPMIQLRDRLFPRKA